METPEFAYNAALNTCLCSYWEVDTANPNSKVLHNLIWDVLSNRQLASRMEFPSSSSAIGEMGGSVKIAEEGGRPITPEENNRFEIIKYALMRRGEAPAEFAVRPLPHLHK